MPQQNCCRLQNNIFNCFSRRWSSQRHWWQVLIGSDNGLALIRWYTLPEIVTMICDAVLLGCNVSDSQESYTLWWCHNERDSVSNHQPHDCLLNRLFRHRSKKTSKLRVTGLCAGNSPVTGEFPAQRASNAENVSIRWSHHDNEIVLHWDIGF